MTSTTAWSEAGKHLDSLIDEAKAVLPSAVNEDTAKKYEGAFRLVWKPLCEGRGMDPLGAGRAEIVALFDGAMSGEIRRFSKGNTRTGAVCLGQVEILLSAVRYSYRVAGRDCPLELFSLDELSNLRRSCAMTYAATAKASDPAPLMPPSDFKALCEAGPRTRADSACAVAAILSLDARLTCKELASLRDQDVALQGDGSVTLILPGRMVQIPCAHLFSEQVWLACAACMVRDHLRLPRAGAGTGLLSVKGRQVAGGPILYRAIHTYLLSCARQSPALTLHPGEPLSYQSAVAPRLRTGARQLVARAGTRSARSEMVTLTALKLTAMRGLTPSDIFARLTLDDVRTALSDSAAGGLEVRLPRSMKQQGPGTDWFGVKPIPYPTLCAVAAVRELLLVREAARGDRLPGSAPLLVAPTGWSNDSSHAITVGAARSAFIRFLRDVGLGEAGYTWESARQMHASNLVLRGATEGQLLRVLRFRKPNQMREWLLSFAPLTDEVSRAVVDGAGQVDQ
ncbi:hypothetical protein [Arthrobacter sp. NEB 688]|uniref:hypothetical protein n=1 Tax=Arthrobacter sp. NEB 688 TaxID=904039 RepID=UPI0015636D85|nr:hypothetical protein [Arthrobacter sp. NEB 688]QKE82883.1 hypothetical protein HL663_02235 [Arthrobacter sp. NEB 688]